MLVNPNTMNEFQFNSILNEESKNLLEQLKKIHIGAFSRQKNLAPALENVNHIELKKILQCFFLEMVQNDLAKDPIAFLDEIATIIPLKNLQEAVKIVDALEESKAMFEEAKLYLSITDKKKPLFLHTQLQSILDATITLIDNIINGFGIRDFFKPPQSDLQADFKSQKIMTLIGLFASITKLVLPIFGVHTGDRIVFGIFIAISALSVFWPMIKPKPIHLPSNAKNWTKQVQNRSIISQGRKESLDKMASILQMGRHVLLKGPSRVGKTMTAKSFAQAVERGDYPSLKGKIFFYINTTEVIGQQPSYLGGGNDSLSKISVAMGRHRNEIILVFDEIHMACKNKEKIADQFKTFLDEEGEFPHVIGITTEEEYEFVQANHAFSLRFDKVTIENTNQEETLKILCDTFLKNRFKPLIEEGIFDHIYEKSSEIPDAPQPTTSIQLLDKCIHQIETTQESNTEKKIRQISNQIDSLYRQTMFSLQKRQEIRKTILELEKEKKQLQENAEEEKQALHKLNKSNHLLGRVIKEMYCSILKIASIAQPILHSKEEKELKRFLLLNQFLMQSLIYSIKTTGDTLGIKTVIDKKLVDEVACVGE